jgi:hypothetical protein
MFGGINGKMGRIYCSRVRLFQGLDMLGFRNIFPPTVYGYNPISNARMWL